MQFDFKKFDETPLAAEPFPHLVVPGFLGPQSFAEASRDFPKLDLAGLFPPQELSYGPGFKALVAMMEGPELRAHVAAKFGLDLEGRPTFLTVRANARARDGQIHKDSRFKLITLLLYLNEGWAPDGGRLRALRSATDIEDYAVEIPPEGGLLFAFRCTDKAWHGHKPFAGPRRFIQMNYVMDDEVRDRELARHRFSARAKKLGRLFGIGRISPPA